MTKPYVVFYGIVISILCFACSDDNNNSDLTPSVDAAIANTVSERTKTLYNIYCKSCHAHDGTDAPQSFNASAWKSRIAHGKNQLLENAITGVGNMPAQGMCMECTEQDLADLINYMSVPQ